MLKAMRAMPASKDTIYARKGPVEPFEFNEKVADVFPDMLKRSIPGYHEIIRGIGAIARHFITEGGLVYDLGCSLGAATISIREQVTGCDFQVIAVDASTAMVERCRRQFSMYKSCSNIEVLCADITKMSFTPCDLVVLNFTLQFIEPPLRAELLKRLADSVKPGGALILSEKVCFSDERLDALMQKMHIDFKKANGYSDLEIAQKRAALENVLIPDTIDQHRERLRQAGFQAAHTWFQTFNFVSLIAIK